MKLAASGLSELEVDLVGEGAEDEVLLAELSATCDKAGKTGRLTLALALVPSDIA